MSYTIGFDLGTHQTKICIQDASNPAEKTYEFFEFKKPDGTTTVLFPSIVQINLDETVSYGYADETKCLIVAGTDAAKPKEPVYHPVSEFIEPSIPTPKYPKKPKIDKWADQLKKLQGGRTALDDWEDECKELDKKAKEKWRKECIRLKAEHGKENAENIIINNNLKNKYKRDLENWERKKSTDSATFRYFKLNAFTSTGEWNHNHFDSKEITVWYIAYILLLLKERYKDFNIQFGAPVSGNSDHRSALITKRAYSLYIAAWDLSERYSSVAEYLRASYKELRNDTNIQDNISEEIINNYIFDDIPEAFAGLISATTQKRLGLGIHMLADIGGGTTDMAMFFVEKKEEKYMDLPDVINITSFSKGLNFIFENSRKKGNESLNELQERFMKESNSQDFKYAIGLYKDNLRKVGDVMIKKLYDEFYKSRDYHGKDTSDLERSLWDQPIIYCGGGSMYGILRTYIDKFTEVRRIDKNMLNIQHVLNDDHIEDSLYPILAISYGLASFEKEYDAGIKCTDITELFKKCLPEKEKNEKIDYDLIDD